MVSGSHEHRTGSRCARSVLYAGNHLHQTGLQGTQLCSAKAGQDLSTEMCKRIWSKELCVARWAQKAKLTHKVEKEKVCFGLGCSRVSQRTRARFIFGLRFELPQSWAPNPGCEACGTVRNYVKVLVVFLCINWYSW